MGGELGRDHRGIGGQRGLAGGGSCYSTSQLKHVTPPFSRHGQSQTKQQSGHSVLKGVLMTHGSKKR